MSHALLRAWERTVRLHGAARAVVQAVDRASVTFRELDARATRWRDTHAPEPARFAGRAVVFAAPNGIAWFEIFLGILKAGGVVVPLDSGEPPQEQQRIASSARAAAWWTGTELREFSGARRFRDPDICLIKMTSGSTGRPRTLVFTAGQVLADGRQVTSTMGIARRDLNYALIPLGHAYGLGNLTIPLLDMGTPLVCGSAPLPHAVAADFSAWKPTVFPGVPALWRALAGSDIALRSLRLGITAGAPLASEVARDFSARFGLRLHSLYGSSETGGITYDRTGRATLDGGVGRALRGVRLTLLKGSRLRVSSASVFTHANPRGHGEEGSWVMPDRVCIDPRGSITLKGRRDTTVKIAGRRLSLADVCERIRRIPGVRDAWVGVSTGSDPQLGAVVATDRNTTELRAALMAATPVWKIPKKWRVLPRLPLTARGKQDSRALQALAF